MDHNFYNREDELKHCKICGGAEGTLPTECPGRKLTEKEEHDIWNGKIDFKNNEWIKV